MTVLFPIIELVDRLAIAEVKWERTQSNFEELAWYQDQFSKYDHSVFSQEYQELKEIHRTIWTLEAALKSGQEHTLSLEEIGRRAVLIRDYNRQRIQLKNTIADKLNCPVREIKSEHLSEQR